jgi:hypothetical protein
MPVTQIEPDQLLNAALQMPEEDFQRFVKKLFTLKAQARVPSWPPREMELMSKINLGLSPADARRMRTLIAKRQSYLIQDEELQELVRLTDEAERLNVERLKHLLELAYLRGVTLDEVMEQLGIRPATL